MGIFNRKKENKKKPETLETNNVNGILIPKVIRNEVSITDKVKNITRTSKTAIVSFNPSNRSPNKSNRSSLVTRNRFSSNTKRASMTSDYDLARVERLYEKEGIIRKFVTTATAKALRAGFEIIPNRFYEGPDRKKWHKRITDEVKRITKASGTTWTIINQTALKEVFQYGNTYILKLRVPNEKTKIEKLILDDPLFYEAVVDTDTQSVVSYLRKPYLRPRPQSEDTFNGLTKHLNMFPSLTQTDTLMRDMMWKLGYYNPSISKKKEKAIKLRNLIHIKYMIEKNAPMAMPPAMSTIVDIEDMRTLEENLVLLGWQYGHPILQLIVNCEGLTEDEATLEINRGVRAIEDMDSTGFLATTERVSVKMHYPNGESIPIDKFAEYMQGRVTQNLDTAALLLGDGGDAGRSAGEAIEASSSDIIQMVANIVGDSLEEYLIRDIFEHLGGKGNILPVTIKVKEIDRNKRTADIANMVNMVNTFIMPASRLLEELGQQPLTKEETKEIAALQKLRNSKEDIKTVNPSNQHGETSPGTTKD